MKTLALVGALASAVLLTGCVVMPTAPMVAALPGSQKSSDQFRVDDDQCRGEAQLAVSAPGQAAAGNAAANAAVSTAIGAAAGALIGSVSGDAGAGAAIGAGTGLLFGSAAGSNYAGVSSYDLQRQFDSVYLQCMYARGHRVPAAFVYRQPGGRYAAPRYPPPDYPPPTGVAPPGSPPPGGTPPARPAPTSGSLI